MNVLIPVLFVIPIVPLVAAWLYQFARTSRMERLSVTTLGDSILQQPIADFWDDEHRRYRNRSGLFPWQP